MTTNSTSNSTTIHGEAPFDFYPYTPSSSAAYAYIALFGIGAFTHFVFMFRFRSWFFIPLILGCIAEGGGYYGRAWLHQNVRLIGPFVMQYILLLSSPPFLAATIYMILGRMGRNLNAVDCSAISPRWSTKIFVLADIICFVTQFAGAVMAGSTEATEARNGEHIVLGGLFLQIFMFILFLFLTFKFQKRFGELRPGFPLRVKRHFIVLYTVSGVFLFRNIIRVVEFAQGSGGFIESHEFMLYVFDGTLMIFIVYLLAVVHPGSLFKAARRSNVMEFDNEILLAGNALPNK